MRGLAIIFFLLVELCLVAGFLLNNVHWIAPQFSTLDATWAVPPGLQLGLLAASIILGILWIKQVSGMIRLGAYLISALLTSASWYHITLSNATNALNFGVHPIWVTHLEFERIDTIRLERNTLEVKTDQGWVRVPVGIYPFGLDSASIRAELHSYGQCEGHSGAKCIMWRFEWP